jgi:hypothetical protein
MVVFKKDRQITDAYSSPLGSQRCSHEGKVRVRVIVTVRPRSSVRVRVKVVVGVMVGPRLVLGLA